MIQPYTGQEIEKYSSDDEIDEVKRLIRLFFFQIKLVSQVLCNGRKGTLFWMSR